MRMGDALLAVSYPLHRRAIRPGQTARGVENASVPTPRIPQVDDLGETAGVEDGVVAAQRHQAERLEAGPEDVVAVDPTDPGLDRPLDDDTGIGGRRDVVRHVSPATVNVSFVERPPEHVQAVAGPNRPP